jgi:hypothetical protein|tara:strand:+ start:104 stop:529 length:426 start_codon:yes stop_codon:yes gene_type:complete
MKTVDLQELGKYLRKKGISPTKALNIIQRSVEQDKTRGPKFQWKMLRFTLYLWERHKEYRSDPPHKGLGKRIDTIKRLCKTTRYVDFYRAYSEEKFNYDNECKRLADLVSEPRQRKYFNSKYFKLEGRQDKMAQPLIDKLR